ncbi:hypothetical protein [Nocardia sp. CS682]|uniref:hypothetical protein n=1 Tax=Nocardia sp. CS682 TaxID=1047172 RepID=UPI0010752E79|nr:hypothetical protein [Nocardia sp. CS682]QBS44738.1 hypothetical protein DMB37_36295 [Nocardia sp. CS682]
MTSVTALLVAAFLGAVPLPAAQAEAVWLHDDIYVSAGKANAYIDVRCPKGQQRWTLTVRLTAVKPGQPTATGSLTTSAVICDGETRWRQHPITVRPDSAPFFASRDECNVGVAELRDPNGTLVEASTRRMYFYAWN